MADSDVLSGAAMGASAGSAAGPYGALIGGVIGGAYGMYSSGNEPERPKFNISSEYYQNLSQAEQQAMQGMSEQAQQNYLKGIERSQAYTLRSLGDRKSGLRGVAQTEQTKADALSNLALMSEQQQQKNIQTLYGIRGQMGAEKTQQFQINELNPYYEERARQNAQSGATQQNLARAGASLASQSKTGQQQAPLTATPQGRYSPQQQPQSPYVPTYQMDQNQTQGFNQNTTPDPYAGQMPLSGAQTYNNVYNWGQPL